MTIRPYGIVRKSFGLELVEDIINNAVTLIFF